MSLSNAERNRLVGMFDDLPEGLSARNHHKFTPGQAQAVFQLRKHFTPVEISEKINISVYKVHKLVNYAKSNNRAANARERKAARVAGGVSTTTGATINATINATTDATINATINATTDVISACGGEQSDQSDQKNNSDTAEAE